VSWCRKPPIVGARFLEKATRKQYVEMRDEMIRRSALRTTEHSRSP
jgi:hypothetical protein